MKKLTLLLTALAVILSVAGCGAKNDDKAVEDSAATIILAKETAAGSKEEVVEETTGSELTVDTSVVSETTEEEKVYKEHTLQKGENILYISKLYYGDNSMVKEIMELNDIEDMDKIYEGQVIKLPNPDDLELMEPGTDGAAVISEAKIKRAQMRETDKETLNQIIDNKELDDVSKQEAVNKMIEMTEIFEKEEATELLLSARGYDCLVTITDGSVDVLVNTTELTDVQRAQIEDIVKRKTDCSADKIVISPIKNLQ